MIIMSEGCWAFVMYRWYGLTEEREEGRGCQDCFVCTVYLVRQIDQCAADLGRAWCQDVSKAVSYNTPRSIKRYIGVGARS
jgi:hypothetical protein